MAKIYTAFNNYNILAVMALFAYHQIRALYTLAKALIIATELQMLLAPALVKVPHIEPNTIPLHLAEII